MRDFHALEPGRSGQTNPRRAAQHVHATRDSFGAVVANYFFFTDPQILYVRWHGHVTGDEFVRAAQTGLQLNQQWQPRGLFHDQRGSSGEWGEDAARTWLAHEWIPGIQTQCPHLRGIALLLDSESSMPYGNTQLLLQLARQFDFHAFYALLPAWRWLHHLTQPRAATG